MTKPPTIPVTPENIPADVQAVDRWVVWRWEQRGGKWTKPPYQPNGRPAKANGPETWTTFAEAVAAWQTGDFDGIGFVLTGDDDLTGIDLDHCVEDLTIDAWALEVVRRIGSYAEISPSGTGLRILCRGKLPAGRRKAGNVEMYDTGRYLTFTGKRISGDQIEYRQEQLEAEHSRWFKPETPTETRSVGSDRPALTDSQILELARNARNGATFDACYRGDNSHTADGTDSAGDLSLLCMLAFYTKDTDQLDRLFRGSGRMRDKWNRDDYRDRTIRQALDLVTEQYEPAGNDGSIKLPDRQVAAIEHRGDFEAAARTLNPSLTLKLPGNAKAATVDLDGCVIPADVWEARPELAHIRRAAWSRGRSADAVLAATLARVVADTPHTVRIPPIVGAPAGLTLIAAIAGPPGTGKSSGAGIAAELWPARLIDPACDGVPPGSGEGFIELLFDWVPETDPATGKKNRIHRQTRHNAYMFVDEGDVLAKLATRQSGSTLLSHIRTAFTGGTLGQSNASQDRKRIVPAGQYVYGVVLGIQPELAGPLFDEAGAGTPQRILWASATAPTPPPGDRPDWPGPLERPSIAPPTWARHEKRGAFTRHDLAIPESVAHQIKERDHHRQQHGAAALEEHRDLIQLKVAAALAILDGRLDLTTDDWQLAAEIVDTSSRVRDRLADHLRQLTADREAATADRLARRQVEAAARTAEWFMVDTARKMAAKVRAEPGEYTRRKLRGTFTPQRREVFDDALDHAKTEGWIEERDEPGQGTGKKRLYPGDTRP